MTYPTDPLAGPDVLTDALSGRYGPVRIDWRLEKRTAQDAFLADLTPGFLGGSIDADNSRATFRTATILFDPTLANLDPTSDLVAVIADVLVHPPGVTPYTESIQCGLFALTVPTKTIGAGNVVSWSLAASDLSVQLVQATTTQAYTVAAGQDYITGANAVLSILAAHSLNGVIVSPGLTLPAALTWPAGTPWLTVINDLLGPINYYPLWFDRTGVARSSPQVDFATYPPTVAYTDSLWLLDSIAEKTDTTHTANVVIGSVNQPAVAPISSVKTNADPRSRVSTVRTGKTVTKTVKKPAPSQAMLDAVATQKLLVESWGALQATITTQIDPRRDAHELYSLTDTAAGYSNDLWAVETWKFNIGDPSMQHVVGHVDPVAVT